MMPSLRVFIALFCLALLANGSFAFAQAVTPDQFNMNSDLQSACGGNRTTCSSDTINGWLDDKAQQRTNLDAGLRPAYDQAVRNAVTTSGNPSTETDNMLNRYSQETQTADRPGSGVCDWTGIKESLYSTESAASGGYTAVGPETKYGRPLGKYQFIPPTQSAYIRRNPNCNGGPCGGRQILETRCHGVQECLMDALLADNLESIKKNQACQTLLGPNAPTVSGCGQGKCLSCKATESGLLAAYHLGGTDECGKLLKGSGDSDNTGTSTAYYVCKHGGLPVPGACTPQDYGAVEGSDTFTNPATLTYKQLKFMQESGDGDNINVGEDELKYLWVSTLQLMTQQLNNIMMQQVQAVGHFFDAKHQLEVQRLIQEKTAEAHKRYQPSEQVCTIGTAVRNLAETERRALLTQAAMMRSIMDRALGTGDSQTRSLSTDQLTIEGAYLERFCSDAESIAQNADICKRSTPASQANADLNFTELIDLPLTIDVDLMDDDASQNEETLYAFLDQIFMHRSFPHRTQAYTKLAAFVDPYMEMRSLIAIRSVAENSMAAIIAQKTQSTPTQEETAAPFIRALLRDMGIGDNEIEEMLGENPSYYAQMEVLTRQIYYHPEFTANLYDKPANVKRMAAALTAIKSMQNWQISEAMKRREMLVSMLLELKLREKQRAVADVDLPMALYGRPEGSP